MSYVDKEHENEKGAQDPLIEHEKGTGFRVRLKAISDKKGIRGLSKETGISYGALQKYLNGTAQPKLENLIALADAAGVDINWLARGEKNEEPEEKMYNAPIYYINKTISLLSISEQQELAKFLARKGAESLLLLLDENNFKLIQQPTSLKVLMLREFVGGDDIASADNDKVCAETEGKETNPASLAPSKSSGAA